MNLMTQSLRRRLPYVEPLDYSGPLVPGWKGGALVWDLGRFKLRAELNIAPREHDR